VIVGHSWQMRIEFSLKYAKAREEEGCVEGSDHTTFRQSRPYLRSHTLDHHGTIVTNRIWRLRVREERVGQIPETTCPFSFPNRPFVAISTFSKSALDGISRISLGIYMFLRYQLRRGFAVLKWAEQMTTREGGGNGVASAFP
jgi:hypothetical protein